MTVSKTAPPPWSSWSSWSSRPRRRRPGRAVDGRRPGRAAPPDGRGRLFRAVCIIALVELALIAGALVAWS